MKEKFSIMKNNEKTIKDCGGIQPEKLIAPNNVTELVFILDRSGSMAGENVKRTP